MSAAAGAAVAAPAARRRLRAPRHSAVWAATAAVIGGGSDWLSSRSGSSRGLTHSRAPAPPPAAAAAGGGSDASSGDDDFSDGGVACAPAFVTYSADHPDYSSFAIDAPDYPGLLRVVCWVFNGLGCRVHNAVLRSDAAEGRAEDVFWVTDLRGRKLAEAAAVDVATRLEDYLSICAPPASEEEFREFHCGDISITNLVHPTLTQVSITADLFSPGLLLELASILHGQGLSVVEGVIRGGSDNPITPAAVSDAGLLPAPPPGRRVMRFRLAKRASGGQLTYDDVSALVYTLRAVLGGGSSADTHPPNMELAALSCGGGSAAGGDGTCTTEPGSASDSDAGGGTGAAMATGGGSSSSKGKRGKGGVNL